MLGPVSRARLALVHPVLGQMITDLDNTMSESLGVTQGLRKTAEQAALYAQGRQPIDSVNVMRKAVGWAPLEPSENSRTVTNAKPGESWHEYGLAVDVVPLESSGLPDWNETHEVWQELISKAETLGLRSGISWHDQPHLQITGRFPYQKPTDEVRSLYELGGLQAVWDATGIQPTGE